MIDAHDRKLSDALKDVGYPPSVVAKALHGHWSDFKSTIAFPKMELVKMLTDDGHEGLVKRVVDGEFDG